MLMIGTSYPYIEYLPKPGDCRCIQIDSNAQSIGLPTPRPILLPLHMRAIIPHILMQTHPEKIVGAGMVATNGSVC